MANVKSALNVRSEANESSEKVGILYKDCGGTILERKDGIHCCSPRMRKKPNPSIAAGSFLYFFMSAPPCLPRQASVPEARDLANDVGKMVATISTETLRVRSAPSADSFRALLTFAITSLLSGSSSVSVHRSRFNSFAVAFTVSTGLDETGVRTDATPPRSCSR